MPNKLDEIELRSEEVQDILLKIPHWMIRWGSLLFLLILLMLLTLSWYVKYPDIIKTEAIITTYFPPQKEYARISGKFDSIYVKESQVVQKNTVLAVLENPARAKDVYYLKAILDSLKMETERIEFPIQEIPALLLGDIEIPYANFENDYTEYQLNRVLLPYKNEVIANEISLNELRFRLQNMRSQYALNKSELNLKQIDLNRNKTLLDKGVISQMEYENKQLEVINAEKALKNLNVSISQLRQDIANASRNLKGTEITRTREEAKLLRNALQSLDQLKKAVRDWENTFVLKSEIYGRVSFLNYWSSNQTVNMGDLVFTIIPKENENENYLAKVKAVAKNSGKIRKGQTVNIKLQNYPEVEFGMLKGKVSSISLTPDNEGNYLVDVLLPNKLITNYGKEIEFTQEMQGNAEIITEDLRLLERFLYQFRKLMNR